MEYEYFRPIKLKTPETGLGRLARNIVSSGARAVSDISGLATLPESIYKGVEQVRNNALENALQKGGDYLYGTNPEVVQQGLRQAQENAYQPKVAPLLQQASENVESLFPEQYLQPHTQGEETAQEYASMIPVYLLGGGSLKGIPSFLGKVFAGRKVGEQVKKAGYGEFGRIASEIGVPALLTALSPSNIQNHFKSIQQKDYNEILPSLAEGKAVNAKPFVEALEKVADKSKKVAGANRHLKNLNGWLSEVENGQLPLSKLQPLKAEINELVYDTNNKVYKPLANALTKMGRDSINEFPEYGHALKRADKITQLYADSLNNGEFVKNSLKSIPITKKSWAKKGINLLWENPAAESAKVIGSLSVNFPKETAEYALKMFDAATKQQTANFIKYASNLGKLIDKSENMPVEKYEYFRKGAV